MKKNIIIAAISVASVILLAASCQKQEEPEIKDEGKTFTAVIDQELTKTTITSEYKVNWDEGDQIDINAGTTYSATPNTSDATKANFTKVSGSDPDGEYGYTAVYPASLFKNSGYELPTTQTYATGKFNAPMCAMSDTESLEFKNFCGVLCFALKGTDKVRSIAVTANEQLCGPFEFMDATAICFTGENEGYTVTLDCGTEGIQLNETTATNFYIYLPPCTYTAGMKMTVTDTDGVKFEKTTTKTVTIERSTIYTFNWTPSFGPVLPEGALPGIFSVSETKKVHFSRGNLYYDGSAFKFEDNQYDFQSSWNANHVNHFYWVNSVEEAVKEGYDEETPVCSKDDIFFTNGTAESVKSDFIVNGVTGKYRTLTKEEWQYLINERKMTNENASYTLNITYGEKVGLVIYPDDFNGSTLTPGFEYTEDTFPSDCVFLPLAGYRDNNGFASADVFGEYWSSSICDFEEDDAKYDAYHVIFSSLFVDIDLDGRQNGYSVRLVTDCE